MEILKAILIIVVILLALKLLFWALDFFAR